jgi:hypothetical protein
MSYRRAITVLILLAVASLACNIGSSGTSVPPSAVPSKTPAGFHNGGVTPEGVTEQATAEEQPTKAPTKAPTKVPTKAPTKPPKPTATPEAQTTGCDTFKASTDVYWVTLDKNNKIDQTVTSYPDGTTTITPVFEYDCNPTTFQIVTVFSFNGKQVFSDKTSLKATDQHDLFGYPLGTTSGNPVDNGEWSVQFFNAKELVASGKVAVGGGGGSNDNGNASTSSTVTVQGTITAKSGGKPINGAVFVVLNEGVTIDQFVKDNYADADIFTGAKSDSSGQFTLPDQLKRNTEYSMMVAAKGFKAVAVDGFKIDDKQPDPLTLDVQLSK